MAGNTQKLAIIGCGFMGSAILHGLLQKQPADGTSQFRYSAHVRSPSSLKRLQQDFSAQSDSINFSCGNDDLAKAADADIILLGFVPGDINTVLGTNNFASHLKGKVVISMLAGISTDQLLEALQTNSPGSTKSDFDVARIIPTLSAKIGESVTLVAEPSAPSAASSAVDAIFSGIGSVHHMPERLMDTATAIGAAVHALAIVAVDTATDASVADGMPRAAALALTAQCLRSCSGLMLEGGMTPESVKSAMSTPAGITLNSVVHLDANVRPGIAGAVRNAVKYTKSMNE